MFLKISSFKTLLKNAWKGAGLTVGNDGEGIYLIGSYWTIWLERSQMTKKAKAAIVELTGELPAAGHVFKAWENQKNQYEMQEVYDEELYHPDTWNFKIKYKDTGVRFADYGKEVAVLQDENSRECLLISRLIMGMVDISSMEKMEERPEGPLGRHDHVRKTTEIFWQNDACTLGCMPVVVQENTKEEFIIEKLKQYDFKEKKIIAV